MAGNRGIKITRTFFEIKLHSILYFMFEIYLRLSLENYFIHFYVSD